MKLSQPLLSVLHVIRILTSHRQHWTWKSRSKATMRTVSSCPGAGMMGSLHTEHLGANFLKEEDESQSSPNSEQKFFFTAPASQKHVHLQKHTHVCKHTSQFVALHSCLFAKKTGRALFTHLCTQQHTPGCAHPQTRNTRAILTRCIFQIKPALRYPLVRCSDLKGHRSGYTDTNTLSSTVSLSCIMTLIHYLELRSTQRSMGSQTFPPYTAHHLTCAIHICSILAVVSLSPRLPMRSGHLCSQAGGDAWEHLACGELLSCSRPKGTDSWLQILLTKEELHTYRICCRVMSAGVMGYGATEGSAYGKHQNTRRSKPLLF